MENCKEFEKPTDVLRDTFMKYIYGVGVDIDDEDYDFVEDFKFITTIANTLDWIDSIIEDKELDEKRIDELEQKLETWKKYWREATTERDKLRNELKKIKEITEES